MARLKLYRGMHRFLPTLLKMEGARVLELTVGHRPRLHGVAKYHLTNRLLGPFLDLFAVRWMQSRHLSPTWDEIPPGGEGARVRGGSRDQPPRSNHGRR